MLHENETLTNFSVLASGAFGLRTTTSTPLIRLREVYKVYRTPAGDYAALKDINLTIRRGEFVAVVGKSGSGKSTLLNMLTGIDTPTSGEVMVDGVHIHRLSDKQLARWRGNALGVIFQFFQLLPTLTVLENVKLPMDLGRRIPRGQRVARARNLLEQVGLAETANKFPSELSGGQQQRAAIARALANDPAFIVADEPTGNLDSKTTDAIFRLFTDLVRQGKTLIMVTHDGDLAARASHLVELYDGQITRIMANELRSLRLPEQVAHYR